MVHTHTVTLPLIGAADAWRKAARALAMEGVRPEAIMWRFEGAGADLFDTRASEARPSAAGKTLAVPRSFLALAEAVLCHRDAQRFALLYRVLWRLEKEKRLLDDPSDRDVCTLRAMEKSVRRDSHKMKAFVRFRDLDPGGSGRRRFGAWFEPDHHIVERTAPFFARRFGDMDWVIATPDLVSRYENGALSYEKPLGRPDFGTDAADGLWQTYFANIFNPARLKTKAMTAEMPKKYWKNLPEAALIPDLIASAETATWAMRDRAPTSPALLAQKIRTLRPDSVATGATGTPNSLREARQMAATCDRCPLHCHATQTVFGEGPADAGVMFVGEQPGDQEDLAGRPFVGPAGQIFDTALEKAGIDRSRCYVTNAVKHFKFEPRGKRRIHQRPDTGEIRKCRWWLDLERSLVKPSLIVALGATAAEALTGDGSLILKRRGTIERLGDATPMLLTIHPSAILRIPDRAAAMKARTDFENDIAVVSR